MHFLTKRLLFILFLAAGQRAVTTWQEMLDLLVTVERNLGLYPTVLIFSIPYLSNSDPCRFGYERDAGQGFARYIVSYSASRAFVYRAVSRLSRRTNSLVVEIVTHSYCLMPRSGTFKA